MAGVSAGAAGGATQPGAEAAAPAPQTVKKSVWGPTSLNGESLWPTYRDLGVGLFSVQARWDHIAPRTGPRASQGPERPRLSVASLSEETVTDAHSHGMKVQMLIMGTPPWANGGKGWRWAPHDPEDFGDFATAIARKYPSVRPVDDLGRAQPQAQLQALHPREVDRPAKLNKAQQVAPRRYAELLDTAYGALKAESPANVVIGGNTYTAAGPADINTFQWIRYMKLPGGSRPRMDMYGHNPWGSRDPEPEGSAVAPGARSPSADLRRLAGCSTRNFPGQPLKLFLAEWGVPTGFEDIDLQYVAAGQGGVEVDQGRAQDRADLEADLHRRLGPPRGHRPQLDGVPGRQREAEAGDLQRLQVRLSAGSGGASRRD